MKMTLDLNKSVISQWLLQQDNDMLLNLWNTYCYERNYSDDAIYHNDEDFFKETFSHASPFELISAVQNGSYNIHHDYIQIDGYGCLNTTNDVADFICLDDLADDMVENADDYDCFVIIK